jgi:hypothetical protein
MGQHTTGQKRGLQRRAITMSGKALARAMKKAAIEPLQYDATLRPRTRGECIDGIRPCPWASCRHHLALEVSPEGSLKHVFPDIEVEDMKPSCSLDVADEGEHTLGEVGERLNVTRERVRQIEEAVAPLVRIRLRRIGA